MASLASNPLIQQHWQGNPAKVFGSNHSLVITLRLVSLHETKYPTAKIKAIGKADKEHLTQNPQKRC